MYHLPPRYNGLVTHTAVIRIDLSVAIALAPGVSQAAMGLLAPAYQSIAMNAN